MQVITFICIQVVNQSLIRGLEWKSPGLFLPPWLHPTSLKSMSSCAFLNTFFHIRAHQDLSHDRSVSDYVADLVPFSQSDPLVAQNSSLTLFTSWKQLITIIQHLWWLQFITKSDALRKKNNLFLWLVRICIKWSRTFGYRSSCFPFITTPTYKNPLTQTLGNAWNHLLSDWSMMIRVIWLAMTPTASCCRSN